MTKITESQLEALQVSVNESHTTDEDSRVVFNLIEEREEMISILKEVEIMGSIDWNSESPLLKRIRTILKDIK